MDRLSRWIGRIKINIGERVLYLRKEDDKYIEGVVIIFKKGGREKFDRMEIW